MSEPTIVYAQHELIQRTIRETLGRSLAEIEMPAQVEYEVSAGFPMLDASAVDVTAAFSTPTADYQLSFSLVTPSLCFTLNQDGNFELGDNKSRVNVEDIRLVRANPRHRPTDPWEVWDPQTGAFVPSATE